MRPLMVDICSGAGGAGYGYHEAGFDLLGVDNVPQPRYPFPFVQADAMEFLASCRLDRVAAVHISPPCDDHSALANVNPAKGTGWMLEASRRLCQERLDPAGIPWVIENVATAPMPGSLVLCGTELGCTTTMPGHGQVWLKRHRRFWSSAFLMGAGGCNCHGKKIISVHGGGAGGSRNGVTGRGAAKARREVMGVDWMTTEELDRAIPPAYTEHIGWQIMAFL